jgi:hypothetical protein
VTAQKAKRGRPSSFTQKTADDICKRLIGGESLRHICEGDDMPDKATVLRWAYDREDFRDQYARARLLAGEADADDVAHYARKAATGEIEPAAATAAINGLKWSAGKRDPKKYGEKLAHVGGSPDDPPIQTQATVTIYIPDNGRD